MSKHGSLLRRIALAIIGYAMRVVPPDRSSWARGMRQEIDYIDSDRSALGWAVGCLFAACRERVRAIDPLRTPLARSVLALMIGFEAFQALFAPMMVFSYRLGDIGVTRTLGGLTPGDDYRRFIPLMDTANELPLSLLVGIRHPVYRRCPGSSFEHVGRRSASSPWRTCLAL